MSAIVHTGTHTEDAGPGRVRFVSFFRGAGCCIHLLRGRGLDGRPLDAPGWRPTLSLRGFTLFIRTARSSRLVKGAVSRFRLTVNGNRQVV